MSKLRIIAPVGRCFGPNETFSGAGTVSVLAALPANRVSVVVSNSFWLADKNRLQVEKALRRFSVQIIVTPRGEPVFSRAASISGEISLHNPEYIIAIGGGSVIDYAKLMWLLYEHPDLTPEDVHRPFSAPKLRGKANFVAVPTTAGTGSEASSSAVFQLSSGGAKHFVVTHDFLPDIAILDSNFILGCPSQIKISSGMDALSHAVEGYVSLFKNNQTRDLAEMAVRILLKSLVIFVNSEDEESCDDVMRASHWAGIVQNISIPGIGHAFAHQMSKVGVSHGAACGFFLPMAMRVNCQQKATKDAYDALSKKLGLQGSTALISTIENLNALFKNSILKKDFHDVRSSDDFESLVLADPTARANPYPLTKELISMAGNIAQEYCS